MPRDFSPRSKHYTSCRNCTKRSDTCHGECEEYAKEVIFGIILEAEAKKETEKRIADYEVHERRAMRISKKSRSAKKAMRKNGFIRRRGR